MIKTWIGAFCGLAILAVGAAAEPAPEGAAPAEKIEKAVGERFAQTPPAHPRLFVTDDALAKLKEKVAADAQLSALFACIKTDADALLNQEPLKREKIGKRLLGVSRGCLQRISYLAFAYRMTGEQPYLERARKEMLAAAAFVDWNPSHFLDVAEMTNALAIGYDWLYSSLDPETRDIIRDAIITKGLEPSLKGGSWIRGTNNWNQVCHGGIVIGALAVMESKPDLAAKLVARAVENVPLAMHEYEPDGVYPEGPSYWKYGTTYNILMIAALESALGTDFGLAAASGFRKTPEFYLQATGPTGLFFNYSDCSERGGVATAMYWFAQHLNNPGLLWREQQELALFTASKSEKNGDRLLPFLLIWAQPASPADAPKARFWKGDGRTPVAMFRSAWQEDATYAAIKGGSPSSNHAHMDIGSFVLDMQGVRWGIDLGSQSYESLESRGIDLWTKKQDGGRWTVFRLNNLSHSTLVVDGQLQRVSGNAPISRFSDDPSHPFAIVDMASAYEGQLLQAQRGASLLGKSVLIQDDIKTLDHATNIRWAMATRAEATVEEGNKVILRQDGKTATLRVLAPAAAKLSVLSIEKPQHDYDAENPNARMVTFEASVPASTQERFAVHIEPGEASTAQPELRALADW